MYDLIGTFYTKWGETKNKIRTITKQQSTYLYDKGGLIVEIQLYNTMLILIYISVPLFLITIVISVRLS